eukprot:4835197-Pyramimonas_sp.AAC.2
MSSLAWRPTSAEDTAPAQVHPWLQVKARMLGHLWVNYQKHMGAPAVELEAVVPVEVWPFVSCHNCSSRRAALRVL